LMLDDDTAKGLKGSPTLVGSPKGTAPPQGAASHKEIAHVLPSLQHPRLRGVEWSLGT
jgi:hypothetical protein